MSGGFANMNGGGFGSKPRALMCYICGREYGTSSLQIHLKTCMKKWEIEEMKKPKRERRPMPQPPQQLANVLGRLDAGERVNMDELDNYNNKANDEYNDKALIRCDYCNRTFLPDRLPIHRKICTPEKPFKPLPPPGGKSEPPQGNYSASTSTSSTMSRGGLSGKKPAYQEEEEDYLSSKPAYGGNSKTTPSKVTPKKPAVTSGGKAQPQYKQPAYEEEEEEEYVPPPKTTQVKKQGGMKAAPASSYSGGGAIAEYSNVDLVECDICGRRFAADRLDRHQKACTKIQKGDAKHAKKVAMAQKKQLDTEKFIAKEAKYKKSTWREKHNELVEAMKYTRQMEKVKAQGGNIYDMPPPPKTVGVESTYTECPYCGRKFNQQAAERHIPSCKNTINKPRGVGVKSYQQTATNNAYSKPGGIFSSPNKATATSYGSPNTMAKGKATGGMSGMSGMGSTAYRGGSYGGNDDFYESSYNPSNYGKAGMGQSKQGFGVGSSPNKQFGSPPMNTTKGGGFGMKSPERGSSSLANAGKMAMQDYRYNAPTSKSGYRY